MPECVVGCRNDLDCGPDFGINWRKLVCEHGICVSPQCPKQLHPEYNAVSIQVWMLVLSIYLRLISKNDFLIRHNLV